MAKVAIYARVSKDDGTQDESNQLIELRRWCAASGHEVAHEYVDRVSGSKSATERPQLTKLLADGYKRKFDIVIVWALDRLSREGLMPVVGYLQRLDAAGVRFHSYSEPLISTNTEPFIRDIVLAVMAGCAKQERTRLIERTKAGMQRARAAGKHIGRPTLAPGVTEAVRAALAGGASVREAAKLAGCSKSTAAAIRMQV